MAVAFVSKQHLQVASLQKLLDSAMQRADDQQRATALLVQENTRLRVRCLCLHAENVDQLFHVKFARKLSLHHEHTKTTAALPIALHPSLAGREHVSCMALLFLTHFV
jgi:hypothetical protein